MTRPMSIKDVLPGALAHVGKPQWRCSWIRQVWVNASSDYILEPGRFSVNPSDKLKSTMSSKFEHFAMTINKVNDGLGPDFSGLTAACVSSCRSFLVYNTQDHVDQKVCCLVHVEFDHCS